MKQLQETSKAVDGVQEEPLKHTYFFWQNFNEISENIKSCIVLVKMKGTTWNILFEVPIFTYLHSK